MAAVLETILSSVQTAILGLSLTGVSTSNVVIMSVPINRPADLPQTPYPAILIAPFGAEDLSPSGGTNLHDDITYPILVAILAKNEQAQAYNRARYLLWREDIRKKFHNHRLTGASTVYTGMVTPQNMIDPTGWFEKNLFVSALLCKFVSREART